jgi:hypothetical protein
VYLAQEAVEYIQRLRDDVALENFQDYKNNGSNGNGNTADWYYTSSLLNSECRNADGCDIDLEYGGYKDCSNTATNNNCRLRRNSVTNGNRLYGYNTSWTELSPFTRIVRVGAPVGGSGSSIGGVPVTVTVSWSTNLFQSGGSRSVTLQTYIYDHYSRFE